MCQIYKNNVLFVKIQVSYRNNPEIRNLGIFQYGCSKLWVSTIKKLSYAPVTYAFLRHSACFNSALASADKTITKCQNELILYQFFEEILS